MIVHMNHLVKRVEMRPRSSCRSANFIIHQFMRFNSCFLFFSSLSLSHWLYHFIIVVVAEQMRKIRKVLVLCDELRWQRWRRRRRRRRWRQRRRTVENRKWFNLRYMHCNVYISCVISFHFFFIFVHFYFDMQNYICIVCWNVRRHQQIPIG